MSIREALMEMAKPKTERAEWVPESILDDDVSHFMGAAAAAKKAGKPHFDFGGKKYKVTMKHDTAKKVDESAESCPECGADGECQCEQPVEEAKVDELSTKTMKSYVKKASKQRDKAGDSYSNAALRRHDFAPDTPAMQKNAIKYKKRDSGVDMAQKKLAARESVEQVDELSKKTYKSYFKKADLSQRDAERKLKDVRSKRDIFDKPGGQERKLTNTIKKRNRGMDDARDRIANKESVEENYTDKQDASYREPPVKSLKKLKQRRAIEKGKKRPDPLRNAKPIKFESVEEAVSVKKQDYKWGRMMTVHHGKSHSYPLHPEHQSAIKKLGDNQKTSFKDETGTKVTAHRQGDTVHLSSSKTNAKTPVAHSHFTESVNEAAGTAQHRPTKATSDTFDKQMNNGEGGIPMGKKKDFVNMHNMEVALDAEEIYKKNKYEALSKTPARPGDQTAGDTKPVNPIPANPIDGMRAALAKMKLSGE